MTQKVWELWCAVVAGCYQAYAWVTTNITNFRNGSIGGEKRDQSAPHQ